MKTLISVIALASCLACSHTSDNQPVAQKSAEPTAKGGWETMKEGGRETGKGIGEVAEATGDSIKDSAKETGHAIKSAACPVVADKTSGRYYTKADKQYDAMLKGEKVVGNDMRECFTSDEIAREDGYQSAGR